MSSKPNTPPLDLPTTDQTQAARALTDALVARASTIILGKTDAIRLAVRHEAIDGLTAPQYEALVEALVRIRANLAPKPDCRPTDAESAADATSR